MAGSSSEKDMCSCRCCGKVQMVPATIQADERYYCVRCDTRIGGSQFFHSSNAWTLPFTLAAMILLPLGLFLPVMSIEQMGRVNEASIIEGVQSLFIYGNYFVGTVVLVCSIIFPLCKNVGLILLLLGRDVCPPWVLSRVYRFVELSGRWGMLDVLLVTILVAVLKLEDVVTVQSGAGLIAFTASVVCSICAGLFFDEHSIWKGDSDE